MKHILALLFVLTSSIAFSQINFEPGYYIDNNGNKTEGLIRNVAWKDSPFEFDFKSSEGAEIKTVNMREAKEFNVSSYRFVRYDLKIERSSNNTNKMDNFREIKWNDETLYLKVLVEGDLALYQYEGTNIVKYFYSTGSHTTAEQLIFKEYIDGTTIKNISQYKQQLYNLMKGAFPSMVKFERLKYQKDHLTDLFREYNEAVSATTTDYTKTQNQGKFALKITPGVGFATLEVANEMIPNSYAKFDNKTTFRLGIELEYIMPFNNNKWSLFADPNYQTYKNEVSMDDYSYTIKYDFIELPLGVRHYMFLNDKSKIFIDAVYVLDFNMAGSQMQFNEQRPLEITKASNYAVGVGFNYERLSIEARHSFAHGILRSYPAWAADFSTTNIIFGYRFL